jgi:disulfide bond formation protein DsbB
MTAREIASTLQFRFIWGLVRWGIAVALFLWLLGFSYRLIDSKCSLCVLGGIALAAALFGIVILTLARGFKWIATLKIGMGPGSEQ